MKKLFAYLVLSISLLSAAFSPFQVANAAPSGLYFTPATGTYTRGASFNVQLRVNSNSPGVQASIDFDRSKLQVTAISKQGSGFSNNTTNADNGDGKITVYAINGGDSSDQLVTTFTFQSTNTGNAALTFNGTNQTLRYVLLVGVWTDVTTNNASYTIAAPSGNSPPPPPPPAPNAPIPGSGTTITPPPPAAKPAPSPPNTPASPTPQPTPAPVTPPEPSLDTPIPPEKDESSSNFQPTKPDKDAWETKEVSDVPASSFPWIYGIAALILAILSVGIFFVYHYTHMSGALARLVTTVINYQLAVSEVTETSATTVTITPGIGAVMPRFKLLAFTGPKLLGSGIKRKLLGSGTRISHINHENNEL